MSHQDLPRFTVRCTVLTVESEAFVGRRELAKSLTSDQVEQYRRDGFVSPIPVFDRETARRLRGSLEAFEATLGHPLEYPEKSKTYLLCSWADEIVHHPAVLDAV